MAASKWLDPTDWTFANWDDDTKSVLFNHLWDSLKGAADEHVAFSRMIHDSSFATADKFPDFNDLISLYLSSGGSPTNLVRIENAIYPENCVQTDEVNSSGTDTTAPSTLTLSQLLTGPLGYASGTLLGKAGGLPMQSWQKQYFEVMNYPEFYHRPALRSAGGAAEDWISLLEVQPIWVSTIYKYDHVAATFTSAVCNVTSPTNPSTTDVYIANDLNESAPFSTPQEVRDYTITTINSFRNDSNEWTSANNLAGLDGGLGAKVFVSLNELTSEFMGSDEVTISCDLLSYRFRFKLNDQFRATSPNKFVSPVQLNYFWSTAAAFGTPVFDAFGTGAVLGDVHLDTEAPDGSDYYYYEIPSPDYDTQPPLSINLNSASQTQVFGLYKNAIEPTAGGSYGYYVKPNESDGTGFEYYTP